MTPRFETIEWDFPFVSDHSSYLSLCKFSDSCLSFKLMSICLKIPNFKNTFATQTHAAFLIGIVNLHRYDEWYEMAIDKHKFYRISEIVYTIFVFNSKKPWLGVPQIINTDKMDYDIDNAFYCGTFWMRWSELLEIEILNNQNDFNFWFRNR